MRRLCWAILNSVQFLGTLLWIAFWITVALLATVLTLGRKDVSLWLARRVWAPGQVWIGGARLTVAGREHLQGLAGALVVANHASFLDIPALFIAIERPLRFVAKRELARVPFLGWYIRAMGMVVLDRRDRRAALDSVGLTGELLRAGHLVVSFPSGTRSRDEELSPFRSGGFDAAVVSGVPVVPVAIHGTSRVLPPHGFHVRPGPIRVTIGAPIASTGLDRRALARAAEEAVRALL